MSNTTKTDAERREALISLRRKAGFSQESLAEHLHASRSSVYRWERGEVVPQPRLMAQWAEALGISADELDDLLWSGDSVVRTVGEDEGPDAEPVALDPRPAERDAGVAADIINLDSVNAAPSGPSHADYAAAVVSVLGLSGVVADSRNPNVALALSSFRGAEAIEADLAVEVGGRALPPSFVQGEDDISNDIFFGKRDVQLANQISAALIAAGCTMPLYVEDKAIWRQLCESERSSDEPLSIIQDGEPYVIDVLVVIGLWSNLMATGIADWRAFPEFQMAGDPRQHASRTIRFATQDGLRILDLNASPETEDLGGNPAVLMNRTVGDVHLVVAGGATSLSTLRLAELLAQREIWVELAAAGVGEDDASATAGNWLALECPNAPRWKDRCRLVGSGQIETAIHQPISDLTSPLSNAAPNQR